MGIWENVNVNLWKPEMSREESNNNLLNHYFSDDQSSIYVDSSSINILSGSGYVEDVCN